jgi:phage tail sheath gpL-like
MSTPIALPPEIVTSDKVPRVAIAFDRTSGNKQVADRAKAVLLVGPKLTAGTQPVATPVEIFRESDSEGYFAAGSPLDVMCKAAFAANPNVKLSAVAVAEPVGGVAASATVTFASNASADGAVECFIAGRKIVAAVISGDTPTVIAAALAAAINAVPDLPATATAALGVVTITFRTKGTIGNQTALRVRFSVSLTTTITLNPTTGFLAGGTLVPDITAALAAAASRRYHNIAIAMDDSTSGTTLRTHLETQGNAENGRGEVGIEALVGALSAATTLATALNGVRNTVWWLNGTESMYCEVAAAVAAVMSSEENAARPYNTLELRGIKPPPIEKRPTRTELRNAIDNGVSPLVVGDGERVLILRAVSTYTKTSGNPDYTVLDITVIQCFDRIRDALTLMFQTKYSRTSWADDPADGEASSLPPYVATPKGVLLDIIAEMRVLQRIEGIVERVEQLIPQFVVNKVGTQCQFSIPSDVVEGLHEILGKVVLVQGN